MLNRTLQILGAVALIATNDGFAADKKASADMVVYNAAVTTLDTDRPEAQAFAVKDGKVLAVGSDKEMRQFQSPQTRMIDARGRRVIPGLNDSHSHYLRGGGSFSAELRWDGVPTLGEALEMVKTQAVRTPEGQWVRVVGGFTPSQFKERRMPTPAELTAASPKVPVFVQYFYSVIVLNNAAIDALGLTKSTPEPEGGVIERDASGRPTGVIRATPNPGIFYSLLAKLPPLSPAEAENSTRHLFSELARYGLTSVIDAGGGGFDFPSDYTAPVSVMKAGQLPLRVSFYLFTQNPGKELEDYRKWMADYSAGQNLDHQREHGFELEGGGEWVLWKAGDYENFRSPKPTQAAEMEASLEPVLRQFVTKRWPFRIHATYDESVTRILNVIEKVNATAPLGGLRWAIDHAETISPANMARVKALGGGVAIQNRMYFLGDDFVERYGETMASKAPPAKQLLSSGVPTGMGTDATRSSFNPWVGLYFLSTGKVASGRRLLGPDSVLSREEALRLYTVGSAWFSQEEQVKGRIKPGQFADFAILSSDYMRVPEEKIKDIESDLTVVGGKVAYASGQYKNLAVKLPTVLPAWSPMHRFPSYYRAAPKK